MNSRDKWYEKKKLCTANIFRIIFGYCYRREKQSTNLLYIIITKCDRCYSCCCYCVLVLRFFFCARCECLSPHKYCSISVDHKALNIFHASTVKSKRLLNIDVFWCFVFFPALFFYISYCNIIVWFFNSRQYVITTICYLRKVKKRLDITKVCANRVQQTKI